MDALANGWDRENGSNEVVLPDTLCPNSTYKKVFRAFAGFYRSIFQDPRLRTAWENGALELEEA